MVEKMPKKSKNEIEDDILGAAISDIIDRLNSLKKLVEGEKNTIVMQLDSLKNAVMAPFSRLLSEFSKMQKRMTAIEDRMENIEKKGVVSGEDTAFGRHMTADMVNAEDLKLAMDDAFSKIEGIKQQLVSAEAINAMEKSLNIVKQTVGSKIITDPLTNLYNKTALYSILQSESGSKLFTGCFVGIGVDIDHFKQVNDKLGHDTGDIVLKRVGAIIKSFEREEGRHIPAFRLGGEEIGLLAKVRNINESTPERPITAETEVEFVKKLAEKIRISIEKDKELNEILNGKNAKGISLQRSCTVSIGVSSCVTSLPFPNAPEIANIQDKAKRDDVIKQSAFTIFGDKELYHAKESGRNRSVINSETLTTDLREKQEQQLHDDELKNVYMNLSKFPQIQKKKK